MGWLGGADVDVVGAGCLSRVLVSRWCLGGVRARRTELPAERRACGHRTRDASSPRRSASASRFRSIDLDESSVDARGAAAVCSLSLEAEPERLAWLCAVRPAVR